MSNYWDFKFHKDKGKSLDGPCANHLCQSTKATMYNKHDQKWYCLWCGQKINATMKRLIPEQGKVCVNSKELMWEKLQNGTPISST